MKRFSICMLLTSLFFFVAQFSFASSSEDGFTPKWRVGQRWVVEATYRDLRAPGEVWMVPIKWVFKVRAIKDAFRQKSYVIQVYPQKGDMKVQAILWLAVKDLRPLKVVDIFTVGGKVKTRVRDISDVNPFHPQPLLADDSIVPYDLPVFPLIRQPQTQGADGFNAYRTEAPEKKYSTIRKLGGLSFKRTFKQKNKKPDEQHADAFGAYTRGGETFQVEIANEKSSNGITQLWQEGAPWAISSESKDRKTRLIPHSAPVQLNKDNNENGGDQ